MAHLDYASGKLTILRYLLYQRPGLPYLRRAV